MAERRMFAKTIIDSDAFLDMPMSARLLYYDLSMRADDDGFVNSPKKILRMIGASLDDLNILILKKFILPFDSGVVVIKHWRIHNYIRKDTYNSTPYVEELELLDLDENKAYKLKNEDSRRIVDEPSTQVRLGKDSIDNNIYMCENLVQNEPKCTTQEINKSAMFESFWNAYPKKVNKKKSKDKFYKICRDEETFNAIMKGLEIYKNSKEWNTNNGQFIPHPSTWLNGERWNDEINATSVKSERRTDYGLYETKEDDIHF